MKHKILTGLALLAITGAAGLYQEVSEARRIHQDYMEVLLGADKKISSSELSNLMEVLGTVKVVSVYENPGIALMLKYLQHKDPSSTNRYQLIYWGRD
jgi:hypothetical protein